MIVRRDETGSTTLWILALGMCLMLLGGISVDLWRILAERRELAALADAAGAAAVSAISLDAYRYGQNVELVEESALELGLAVIAYENVELRDPPLISLVDEDTVRVELAREVPFTLLGLNSRLGPTFIVRVVTTTDARIRP